MIRVYCSKCKHLKSDSKDPKVHHCTNPRVTTTRVVRTWLEEKTVGSYGNPEEMNCNNECQLFEPWGD